MSGSQPRRTAEARAGAGPKATASTAAAKHGAPREVAFGEIRQSEWQSENIQAALGEVLKIAKVEFVQANRGEVAIITTTDGQRYHTFSKVLISQLKNIEPYLTEGIVVAARLVKVKNYLTFE
jgi:hypothetical protein